jgi:outer membrane protein OmpA-like peptidoglycan-associated protein
MTRRRLEKLSEKLAKISGIVLAYPTLTFGIEGNTDSVGSDAYNQGLSERRAEAVRRYLAQQGVPESSMTAKGRAKPNPLHQTVPRMAVSRIDASS